MICVSQYNITFHCVLHRNQNQAIHFEVLFRYIDIDLFYIYIYIYLSNYFFLSSPPFFNDPSADSSTDTLLRLLLPLIIMNRKSLNQNFHFNLSISLLYNQSVEATGGVDKSQ